MAGPGAFSQIMPLPLSSGYLESVEKPAPKPAPKPVEVEPVPGDKPEFEAEAEAEAEAANEKEDEIKTKPTPVPEPSVPRKETKPVSKVKWTANRTFDAKICGKGSVCDGYKMNGAY